MQSTILAGVPHLLGVLSAHPRLSESIPYQLTGLAVVFIALGLIWVSMEILGLFFRQTAKAPVQSEPATVAAAAPVSVDLPPELIAVIAATVQVSFGGPHRIQAIIPVPSGQDWASEGRRQIFASHQVR